MVLRFLSEKRGGRFWFFGGKKLIGLIGILLETDLLYIVRRWPEVTFRG